jgi:tetratricopeptide (TPR) repeat protein
MIALQVKLTEGEQAQYRAKYTKNLEAYFVFLQAKEYLYKFSKEGNALARQKFQESITLEPEYPPAYGGLAGVYLNEAWQGWSDNPEQSGALAMQYAQKCVTLDESNSSAHAILGIVYLVLGLWEEAIKESELAVSLSPNNAESIWMLAVTYTRVGRAKEALSLLEKAIRLNPMPPNPYLHEIGTCHRLMGRYTEAIAVLKKVLNRSPDYLNSRLNLIATYVMSGDKEAACIEAAEVLKQSPDFSIARFLKHFPYKDQKILDALSESFRIAGLPD